MNLTMDPSLAIAARVLVGLVFLEAVVGKFRHYTEFVGIVVNYRVLPERLGLPAAWVVIALEAGVIAMLAYPPLAPIGAALAAGLLFLFAVAMAVNIARGRRDMECGCFQAGLSHRLGPALLLRNLVLIAVCAVASAVLLPDMQPIQWLNGVGAGLALFVVHLIFGQMLELETSAAAFRKRFS